MPYRFVILVCSLLLMPTLIQAGDWPGFRGPQGNGLADESDVPVKWSAIENVKWKKSLPQPSNGSPIVSAGRVFVACAEDVAGKLRSLYCFDRETGNQEWVQTVDFGMKMPTHKTNPYCGTTPAADGQRVVVWHGSAGLHCYDFSGQKIWSRSFGEFRHIWGYGTSPIIHGERVILHTGPGERVSMLALDLATGNTVWEKEERLEGDGSTRADGKYKGSWSTPIITTVGGQQQVICAMPNRLVAYDISSGEILWHCDGLGHERGDLAYSSPIIAGNICVDTGGFGGPGIGVRLGGSGDITSKSRLWRNERNPQSIGTGVFVEGYVYRPNAGPNTIECIDPRTGKSLWKERTGGGALWGSIVYVSGRGYLTDQDGTTFVFSLSPDKLKVIARNRLDETCNATPAISDRQVFIRTYKHLYCIGE
jgi:outer membrane protein assembly factor BamB